MTNDRLKETENRFDKLLDGKKEMLASLNDQCKKTLDTKSPEHEKYILEIEDTLRFLAQN